MTRIEVDRRTDEALRILSQHRTRPITMAEVAKRVGWSRPNLYRHLRRRWAAMHAA